MQRVAKFCRYLPRFDYHPVVVAPQPSAFFMADEDMLSEVSHVDLHRVAGLDSFRIREKLVGPLKPRVDSPVRWLVKRFMWPDSQSGYIPAAFRTAHRLAADADAIMVTSPPWSNMILGRLIKRISQKALIVDMRDPWSGHPHHDRPRWKRALNKRTERGVLEYADAVIAATQAHMDDLRHRYPYLAPRIRYIPNGFDRRDFEGVEAKKKKGPLTVCYTGILGLDNINRGTTLYKALRSLRDQEGLTPDRLQVHIMGEVSSVEAERIRRSGVSTFIVQDGFVPHRLAMGRLKQADLAWLPYHSEYSKLIVPAKTYEYIGSGTPILVEVNSHHETAELVKKTGTGLVVPEGNVGLVLDALKLLLSGRFPYSPKPKEIARFDRCNQTRKLAGIVDELTRYGRE